MRTSHGATRTFAVAALGATLPLAFRYTGTKQTFVFPAGVTEISISAHGAAGSTSPSAVRREETVA